MKQVLSQHLLSAVAAIFIAVSFAHAQDTASTMKVISSVAPVFPAGADDPLYGDKIKVAVEIDKKGNVKAAYSHGAMIPCSNLNDPLAEAIRRSVINSALATIFVPVLKEGKPIEVNLVLTYRLPVRQTTPSDDEKPIVGGVVNGKAISLPRPNYPNEARAARAAGQVNVQILIDEAGSVLSAGVQSGHYALTKSTIQAACKARFSPTLLADHPVKVSATITYNFMP